MPFALGYWPQRLLEKFESFITREKQDIHRIGVANPSEELTDIVEVG